MLFFKSQIKRLEIAIDAVLWIRELILTHSLFYPIFRAKKIIAIRNKMGVIKIRDCFF